MNAAGATFGLRRAAAVAGLLLLLGPSSEALGAAFYTTDGSYNPTNPLDPGWYDASESSDTHVSFSRPVGTLFTLGANKSYATTAGYADASTLQLGASGWAVSTVGNGMFTDASIYTEATNGFTILPGTSGLAIGDKTTLQVTIRLDGTLSADARSWPGQSWAHAEMSAGLKIHDYAVVVDTGGDGSWSPPLLSFGASSSLEAYNVYKPYWGYAYYGFWDESWSVRSNLVPSTSHNLWWENKELSEGMYFTGFGHSFNTGILTVSFQAIVGHTLNVDASLDIYVDANREAEVWADFDKTFGFGVKPTVAGLELDWDIPVTVPSTVPETGGLWLSAIGLLSVIVLRRVRPAILR